jgi:hypothetical protein
MKLLLNTEDDDGNSSFTDFYINEKKIVGWYLPQPEDDGVEMINLFFQSHILTVVRNKELVLYLDDKFNINYYKSKD